MGKYVIQGGKRLSGELKVNGGKNAILPIMAATVLNGGTSVIHNCPKISDLYITIEILKTIGCSVTWEGRTLIVNSQDADEYCIPEELVRKMRSSIVFLGAILGRFGRVKIAYPGGCEIGARPIDLHLKAIRKMGAEIKEEDGFIFCRTEKLKGAKINLNYPSVGATENIMLAAVKAEGRTVIYNAAMEPEIVDLQTYLNKIGARVKGAGTDTIYIDGVKKLHEAEHAILPDRIEAGTFLTAAAITGGEITLTGARPSTMRQILLRLMETGCTVKEEDSLIYLKAPRRLKAPDIIKTQPYPGFPTDMQPQLMSLLTLAQGTSIIIETVFESRFKHIVELCRMGADISVDGRMAVIKGVERLKPSTVECCDLRCGAALILASLAADGISIVQNSVYVERGYEKIEEALQMIGADIRLLENGYE